MQESKMQKSYTIRYLLFALSVGSFSCSGEFVSESELKAYLLDEGNGVKKSVEANSGALTITFRPADLLISQEIVLPYDSAVLEKLRLKYSGHYYFILSLSRNGREALTTGTIPAGEFGDLLQTVSFRMREFVNMTTNQRDTIPLADYVYNRTFGAGSSTDLLIVFDKEQAKGKEWLQINLGEFGMGLGRQSLRFDVNDLEQVPKIDFKSLQQKTL